MLIALVNLSQHVKPAEAVQIAAAVTSQLQNEARQIWGSSSTMVAVPDIAHIPAGARPMFLLDQSLEPGALGDHEETLQGVPMARIFVKEILAAVPNVGVLSGPGFSVSSVVSHEALELDGNPYTNLWATGPDGFDHARERCDAVESSCYQKVLGKGVSVLVSNFVTPRYFDMHAPANAQYDYLGHLKSAFSIERHGYEIVKPSGQEAARFGQLYSTPGQLETGARYHFGADMPQWRMSFKLRSTGRGAAMAMRKDGPGVHHCDRECCAKHEPMGAVSQ